MQIHGFYYPAGQSKKSLALLQVDGVLCTLTVEGELLFQAPISDFRISDRLGNMPRQLRFGEGELFETVDNEQVDQLLRGDRKHGFSALLHRLESRAVYILPLLLVAALSLWLLQSWVLPNAARFVAFSLPASELSVIGDHTLSTLDQMLLEPSQLSDEKKQQLRSRFDKLTAEIGSGFVYRLHFRRMPENGANAFALPDGSIVVMDGLVELADNPWEIDSVLLHEIAHVEGRHGLQAAFRDAMMTVMVAMMLGDAISTAQATAALPLLLIENNYSQQVEQQSDDFASDYMLTHNIDTVHFSNMLLKLMASAKSNTSAEEVEDEKEDSSIWGYFSTHPRTEDRVLRIQEKVIRGIEY